MIRNSKTPTLVILFLLGVIGVITYNYWSATQRHMRMREALFLSEEKISELLEKKAYADKQVGMGADRVSRLEKDIEALHKAEEQKDREVEDMNARMKKNQQDRDKFAIENAELKDNLLKAQTESILAQQDLAAKTIEFTNKIEQYKQELEIAKKDTSNCGTLVDSKVQEFRNVVAYMARSQFGKYESEKLQDILSNAAKNAGLNNNKVDLQSGTLNNNSPLSNTNLNSNINNNNLALSNNINSINEPQVKQIIAQPNNNNNAQSQTLQQQQQQSLQQQSQTNKQISEIRGKREAAENESTTSEPETNKLDKEICLLPKSLGTCEKSIERYYFDPTSQRCLLFVYSGCGGNENNFESVDACRNRCESSERVAGEQEDEDRRGGDETADRNNNAA